ncbi:hypothetical protein ISF_06656 [Cordyceps fumosorosea ARSEF 2679]|uniref:SWIM-type domain-containing protein n=1 Tax=Cordyceps fumosorosea (strain ARSEF 2679) TaxID=1081104 RepID=A0A167RRX0_CORFA|nr:hypothetical protein ISF_06656 [Cordyceps fumosorosea ARSEF 2679]OAA58873.1 hypothetical protein ISF_06656 [Cordyceps fumosorosea ARSEF 2679]
MPDTLPSQRALLTTLVRALSETHHDEPGGSSSSTGPWGSPRRRTLILTLHVVFPGMLLPALDLLDRNLVRRLSLAAAPGKEDPAAASGQDEKTARSRHAAYTVRSAASTQPRRAAAAATRAYLVHLEAWSCSCAAFAVDAYASTGEREEAPPPTTTTEVGGFGGRSKTWLDDQGAEATPCCKHLLACLLVDEWEKLMAAHVEERSCTREELAGIVAGI